MKVNLKSVNALMRAYNEGYEKGRADAIDEYNRELKAHLRKFSVHSVSDEDFDYIAKQLKEQKA